MFGKYCINTNNAVVSMFIATLECGKNSFIEIIL